MHACVITDFESMQRVQAAGRPVPREEAPLRPAAFLGPEPEARTAATKAAILFASFTPGDDSTPVETSTPHGASAAILAVTLSGASPPERIQRRARRAVAIAS